ncbi:hypothetical protein DYB32_009092 [Aphanomyces invadans]|uniref:RED-like N-terminal domain-containing protein n=1 Tax=Aphanomyces invadans TaxID=157072 RepID=A0A3R6YT37_9STRA|nr:hypothetical protein DYB32_009092 [Aphanomyces invadans]
MGGFRRFADGCKAESQKLVQIPEGLQDVVEHLRTERPGASWDLGSLEERVTDASLLPQLRRFIDILLQCGYLQTLPKYSIFTVVRQLKPMSLSQADFRRLLETPRVAPQGGGGGTLSKGAIQAKFGGKRGSESSGKGPKDREKYKKFKKPAADDDNLQKKPRATMIDPTYQGKYRDRAAERRAGVNRDYEGPLSTWFTSTSSVV